MVIFNWLSNILVSTMSCSLLLILETKSTLIGFSSGYTIRGSKSFTNSQSTIWLKPKVFLIKEQKFSYIPKKKTSFTGLAKILFFFATSLRKKTTLIATACSSRSSFLKILTLAIYLSTILTHFHE